jgi:hypothetical protein
VKSKKTTHGIISTKYHGKQSILFSKGLVFIGFYPAYFVQYGIPAIMYILIFRREPWELVM